MRIEKLLEVVKSRKIYNGTKRFLNNIVIDTRLLKKNDLFIAIIGKEKDGHNFVKEAINKQCSVVIVSKMNSEWINKKTTIIVVDDTNEALLLLGKYYRDMYPIPLIAITGSVGKTTTKELISSILSKKYNVLKSPENYNNRIGVPLTLFNLNNEHQLIVMEMGMNHLGEIHELSMICKPSISVITNIGTAHIGYLNGKKNIKKAKLEITDGMNDGYLILNPFDKSLRKVKNDKLELIYPGNDGIFSFTNLKLYQDKTYVLFHYNNKIYPINIKMPGIKSFENIVIAIQIGLMFQVDIECIIDSISEFIPTEGRLSKFVLDNKVTLIDDSYNASIESLENDISILNLISGRKILIFGDFLELGKYSKRIHHKASKIIKQVDKLEVYLIGEMAFKLHIKNAKKFHNVKDFLDVVDQLQISDCTVLVKGSRKVGLDQVVKYMKKD